MLVAPPNLYAPKAVRSEKGCELHQKLEVSRALELGELLGPNPRPPLGSSSGAEAWAEGGGGPLTQARSSHWPVVC